ncbi:uncharacterized protein LOC129940596 [Eupeodes corollae]|uniref:uncharacterized protein LOC129940596 n=1 Tax=Eupeodes corollae TaxID=290404 RepID=UPI0024937616|nr:uncharacterized protein LOC129940596 [Eupeodes corollae]
MRAFMILSFIAVSTAGRLGYNYQPGASGSNEFISSTSSFNPVLALGGGQGGITGSSISSTTGGFNGLGQQSGISYGINGGSIGSGLSSGIGFGNAQSIATGSSIGSSGSVGLGGSASFGGSGSSQIIDGGLSKEYFIYSAPEEQVHQGSNTQSVSTLLKKNLRVIFIKAPENNGIHNAALQIAKQATEDRTAIYVLSKEPDVSEIANQAQQISENVRAKPEVRFIKYRTAEDALNAQRTIQQQYEALGGSSQSSNEGVAPVLNFASPAAQQSSQGQTTGSASNLVSSASVINSSGSSIGVSTLNVGSSSEQISQSINLGSLGSSSNADVKSNNEYLPPAVKK